MKTNKVISIEDKLWLDFKVLAARKGMSMSAIIAELIFAFLEKERVKGE